MRKKIVGIFVCTLLIATALPVVGMNMNSTDPKAMTLVSNDGNDGISPAPPFWWLIGSDQKQTSHCKYGMTIIPPFWVAQEFKPTKTELTAVAIQFFKAGNPPDNLEITVSIRESLTGSDLTEPITINTDKITNKGTWILFDFQDITVTPENTYYIVCRGGGGIIGDCYCWLFDVNNTYDRGIAWESSNNGTTWHDLEIAGEFDKIDCCFITYFEKPRNNPMNPQSKAADVPTWEVGDSWTYEILHATRDAFNLSMGSNLSCELEWTVADDTGENYLLEGKGKNFSVLGWIGTTELVNSRFVTYESEMIVGKTDLSIKSFTYTAKGYVFIKLGKLVIPLPIHVKIGRNTEFTPHRQILPFPLFDGKYGMFESVFQEEEWATYMFWGLVELEKNNNSFYTGAQGYACNEEQITVPAGTFDTYNLTTSTSYSLIINHYNSDVGNTVYMYTKHLDTNSKWWCIIEYKLISTSYTP